MRLDRLLGVVDVLETRGDPASLDVRSLALDSRHAQPGGLFCCVPGATTDGHEFAGQAVSRGAVALLVERLVPVDVVQARVGEGRSRPVAALLAAALHGWPSKSLPVVGVTGTNGKTTVTHMVGSVLEAAGIGTSVLGTLDGSLTTPEAPALQAALAAARDAGKGAVAMEVSSHSLVQHRVDGVRFAVAVFTNLSHDHLDYHGTMESYFAAKASLFTPERAALGVVNGDDPWGARLLQHPEIPMSAFSATEAADLEVGRAGTSFCWQGHRVRLPVAGRFNVSNALAAARVGTALGIAPRTIASALSAMGPVPGRLELIESPQPFSVLVDYAHTPAALEAVLGSAREMAGGGRVLVVFGAGGDRDRAKRAPMGEVAARLADLAVITSDNSRHEDPLAIMGEVAAGAARVGPSGTVVTEPDRASAIASAIGFAEPGDVVVLAGKGHETVQHGPDGPLAFDDREVARALLLGRGV